MTTTRYPLSLALAAQTLLLGCGGDAHDDGARAGFGRAPDASRATPAPSPTPPDDDDALPALGVAAPTAFAYDSGPGQKDFARALDALRAQPTDWVSVRSAATAALSKDGGHLDAHWLLAMACAQSGEPALAAGHVIAAVAGDPVRFAHRLDHEPALRPLLDGFQGPGLRQLAAHALDQVRRRTADGVVIVARRAPWHRPDRAGAGKAATGGEIYAWDVDGGRFLRLTHTDHTVAGWIRSADGAELAYVTYDRVDVPSWDDATRPVLLGRARVATLDLGRLEAASRPATFTGARALELGYGGGGELLVTTFAATGRWTVGDGATVAVDRATGNVAPAEPQVTAGEDLRVDFDRVAADRPAAFVDGVAAEWQGDPPTAQEMVVAASGVTVSLPEGMRIREPSVAWSPTRKRLVAASVADPCATNPARASSSLYAIDAATGELTHLATGAGALAAVWLDDERVVYEDTSGGLRVVDVERGREVDRYAGRAGAALRGLGAISRPPCTAPELASR